MGLVLRLLRLADKQQRVLIIVGKLASRLGQFVHRRFVAMENAKAQKPAAHVQRIAVFVRQFAVIESLNLQSNAMMEISLMETDAVVHV